MAGSDVETIKLIKLWGRTLDNGSLSVAIGTKMYTKKIARDMEAAGYTRSQKQISSKLKKLEYEYRTKIQ